MTKNSRKGNDTADYAVGKWRPPQEFRFKKGQSGNPKGRRKEVPNIKSMIHRRLLARVNVRENGKSRQISSLEALFVKAVNDALQGRPKALIDICKLLKAANVFSLEELDQPMPYQPSGRITVRIIRPEPRRDDPNQPRPSKGP